MPTRWNRALTSEKLSRRRVTKRVGPPSPLEGGGVGGDRAGRFPDADHRDWKPLRRRVIEDDLCDRLGRRIAVHQEQRLVVCLQRLEIRWIPIVKVPAM